MLFHIGILSTLLIGNSSCSNTSNIVEIEIDAFDEDDDYSEIEEDLEILEMEDQYNLLIK